MEGRQAGLESCVDLYKLGLGLRTLGNPILMCFQALFSYVKMKKKKKSLWFGRRQSVPLSLLQKAPSV